MTFWLLENYAANDPVLLDAQTEQLITKTALQKVIDKVKLILPQKKSLGLTLGYNCTSFVATYLAALQNKHSIFLADPTQKQHTFDSILEKYQPDWIYIPRTVSINCFNDYYMAFQFPDAGSLWIKEQSSSLLFNELALLLSTSGSTGSPKAVRLSFNNLSANACSIANYLEITAHERPVTNLPLYYSYGLSVLNSHLQAGALVLLTADAITTGSFWQLVKNHQATSMAGVPYTYQTLKQMRFQTMQLPALKTLTQAGGKIHPEDLQFFQQLSEAKGYRFYVMYGQTEATARISYLPPQQLAAKLGSIGIAIPDGNLNISKENNELIYQGPNVMLGYAESRQELNLPDQLQGILKTGDIAYKDEDGFFYIKGRLKRFAKLYGLRINLDEIEQFLMRHSDHALVCVSDDRRLYIFVEKHAQTVLESWQNTLLSLVVQNYSLNPQDLKIEELESLFRTSTGKIDYQKFQGLL